MSWPPKVPASPVLIFCPSFINAIEAAFQCPAWSVITMHVNMHPARNFQISSDKASSEPWITSVLKGCPQYSNSFFHNGASFLSDQRYLVDVYLGGVRDFLRKCRTDTQSHRYQMKSVQTFAVQILFGFLKHTAQWLTRLPFPVAQLSITEVNVILAPLHQEDPD